MIFIRLSSLVHNNNIKGTDDILGTLIYRPNYLQVITLFFYY